MMLTISFSLIINPLLMFQQPITCPAIVACSVVAGTTGIGSDVVSVVAVVQVLLTLVCEFLPFVEQAL